ncbi:MAG: alpha/beta fold hydrolase [Candidatus Cybelea sp.]
MVRRASSGAIRLKSSIALAAFVVTVAGCVSIHPQPPLGLTASGGNASLRVGSVSLHHCFGGDYYCGTVRVPLDPAGQVSGSIDIAIAWLPHSDRSARSEGTIVAVEGGPGYGSIGSRSLYRPLYAPLLTSRDMLLVDNRGTGLSGAIVCRPLQGRHLMELTYVTRCGHELGRASDLYGTAIAADDMATILTALQIRKVDMYGDSYGSFFVQAFAGRHPDRVRSLVLDGAYQVTGGSPWYPSTARTLRRAFDIACERSPVCSNLHGSSLDRIERLLAKLRADRAKISPTQVAFVMDSAGLEPLAFRELDAAARAYVDANDPVPLERLVDETYAEEEGAGGPARSYSQGLFVAASCSDNPQAYDMRLQPPERIADWRHELDLKRENDPTLYAPFSLEEFLHMPIDYAYVPLCTTWPVASPKHPAGQPVPPGTRFPDVPVLVLNGDLDTTTTPKEGERAARLFSDATHVIVANSVHVTALDDFYGCASGIVRRFTLTKKVDARCAGRVPALHLVPAFSRTIDEVEAASPLPGNEAPVKQRRAAAAAVLAAADVLARSYEFGLSAGSGLRGGSYTATPRNASDGATLSGIRWTNDLAVSGAAQFDARGASAKANLELAGASTGSLDVTWPTTGSSAQAKLDGTIDGYALHATMPAP